MSDIALPGGGTRRRALSSPSRNHPKGFEHITVRSLQNMTKPGGDADTSGPRAELTHSCAEMSAALEGRGVVLGGWLFSQRCVPPTQSDSHREVEK
jgi:hypothetical protein